MHTFSIPMAALFALYLSAVSDRLPRRIELGFGRRWGRGGPMATGSAGKVPWRECDCLRPGWSWALVLVVIGIAFNVVVADGAG